MKQKKIIIYDNTKILEYIDMINKDKKDKIK